MHTPITPYRKRIGHFEEKAKQTFSKPSPPIAEHDGVSRSRQDNAEYASMVAAVDDSVGAVLAALDQRGLTDNTVVCFFSDNGGLCTKPVPGPTSNLPLRSGKGWLYEGGIREPTIIRAPGVTKAGTVTDTLVVSMDFFPTMLELAGLPLMPDLHADGISLIPVLRNPDQTIDRQLFWHYPHYHGSTWTPGASIRDGDWKLIEFYEHEAVELYNLSEDPGEQHDLSRTHPEKARRLADSLHQWQKRMNAKMPQPNPDHRAE